MESARITAQIPLPLRLYNVPYVYMCTASEVVKQGFGNRGKCRRMYSWPQRCSEEKSCYPTLHRLGRPIIHALSPTAASCTSA